MEKLLYISNLQGKAPEEISFLYQKHHTGISAHNISSGQRRESSNQNHSKKMTWSLILLRQLLWKNFPMCHFLLVLFCMKATIVQLAHSKKATSSTGILVTLLLGAISYNKFIPAHGKNTGFEITGGHKGNTK